MANDSIVEARYVGDDLSVSDFSSAEWSRAHPIPLTHYWSGESAPEPRHAEARLLWSDEALHVRFICNQTEPLTINDSPQTETKSMGLWDRDVCEVFIAPDPNEVERYFELEAAPTGEWLDVAIQWTPNGRESDWKFNSHLTTASRVENDRVTTVMRIPWSESIPQPQPGDSWRVNLFRCVGRDPGRGYVAWQPTMTPQPSFHVPQVFGWLLFA